MFRGTPCISKFYIIKSSSPNKDEPIHNNTQILSAVDVLLKPVVNLNKKDKGH